MVDRRTLAGGLLGLGLAPAAAASASGVIEGAETWSESAMVLYFDPRVRNGLSLRVSRYPERNATWVWCHVLLDGVLYAFTERALPCGPERMTPEQDVAIYAAPGLDVRLTRSGPSAALRNLSFSARIRAHRARSGVDGPGDTEVSVEGTFRPAALRGNSPEGRFERTGLVEATLRAGARRTVVSGQGKAHEQTQTNPRFFTPFTYAMLWGPTASLIGVLSPKRRYGVFQADGRERAVETFEIEPWAPHRRFAAILKDGERIAGSARMLHRYEAPIFGRQWQGRIVRAEAEGHDMVGMINDWRAADLPYGLSSALYSAGRGLA